MLKRIKYVSRFQRDLSKAEIEDLVAKAANKNAELDITGVLMTAGKMFFQVLEGPAESIDELFSTICADGRHTDVLLLSSEHRVPERIYPDWAMRKFSLENRDDTRLEPLRAILETVVAARYRQESLVGVLERGIWSVMVEK